VSDNPKDAFGEQKPSTFHIPPVAILELGEAMRLGAEKYGSLNWRDTSVRASVYYNAIMRHLMQWREGEVEDAESGLGHLAHVMANCAILIDATANMCLIDDRKKDKNENSSGRK
jgi:hypothetical protein